MILKIKDNYRNRFHNLEFYKYTNYIYICEEAGTLFYNFASMKSYTSTVDSRTA